MMPFDNWILIQRGPSAINLPVPCAACGLEIDFRDYYYNPTVAYQRGVKRRLHVDCYTALVNAEHWPATDICPCALCAGQDPQPEGKEDIMQETVTKTIEQARIESAIHGMTELHHQAGGTGGGYPGGQRKRRRAALHDGRSGNGN